LEQLVTIELFGQPYTFKTESDVSKAKEVADYLVEEVARIETQHSKISSNVTKLNTLILAALNISYENIELKKDHSDLLQEISTRTTNLIRALDAAVNIKSLKQVDARNI
jgi:cell division protein ZapA (FtsZ GTPase activity inhibitor)